MTHTLRGWPFVPHPDSGSVPAKRERPRCGVPIHPYEAVWGALLDDVVCGRPAGHNPPHRSVQAVAAAAERDRARQPAASARRREKRKLARLPLADQLAIAVADASEDARWDALGR